MSLTKRFWDQIYQDNIGKMIGVCYRYTRDKHISEDLAHDAFMKAMEKSGTYKSKGCFEAWLRRIVVNTALQYLRKRKPDLQVEDWSNGKLSALSIEDEYDIKNMYWSIDLSKEELLAIIDELPEHHRLVFNLFVIDGYTHQQIGENLGISSGTSKSHLARARKKIQKIIHERSHEKKRKRAFIFFLFPGSQKALDRFFAREFRGYELLPQKAIAFNSLNWSRIIKPTIKSGLFQMPTFLIVGGVVIILAGVTFLKNNQMFFTESDSNKTTPNSELKYAPILLKDTSAYYSDRKFEFLNDSIEKHKPVVVKKKIYKCIILE